MAKQPKLMGQRSEPPAPSDVTLSRHGARQLSPIKAPRLDQRPLTTSYTADRVIVSGDESEQKAALAAIKRANKGIKLEKVDSHLYELKGDGHGHEVDTDQRDYTAYHVKPDGDGVVMLDAWSVLEAARANHQGDAKGASLDHLMFGPSIGGTAPYTSGYGTGGTAPYTSGYSTTSLALASYGQAGSGGRQVVNWVGEKPRRNKRLKQDHRPVVATFDTGCGDHKWLKKGVTKYIVGSESEKDDPEKYADQDSPLLGELDSHSGHGTFVAGIIRQKCPDADLLSIRVMNSDGVVKEWETLHALQVLADRMDRWIRRKDDGIRVDVIVMSLGYYPESEIDEKYTVLLRQVLEKLGDLGVVVVAASGNDATTREFYPAALSPKSNKVPGNDDTRLPVIAVGSLNPDENSIALFNNHGEWIRAWEPGVSLVSTVPRMQGSLQAGVKLDKKLPGEPQKRSSIDGDNFASGFALWSGTSFSAPLLAAKIAKQLLKHGAADHDRAKARKRAWAAVEGATKIRLVPPEIPLGQERSPATTPPP